MLAAWKAIQKDQNLRETYDRIAARAGGKKAIVAIARKLVGRIRACFKKQCLYKTGAQNLAAVAA